MAKLCHVGVPTKKKQLGETYLEGARVHITNPDASPYRFEYLRFEPGSPLPKEVRLGPHIAYEVEDLGAALKGEKTIVPAFDATPELRVAFIVKDGVVVELMQPKSRGDWTDRCGAASSCSEKKPRRRNRPV